jgi:hypothetical protein
VHHLDATNRLSLIATVFDPEHVPLPDFPTSDDEATHYSLTPSKALQEAADKSSLPFPSPSPLATQPPAVILLSSSPAPFPTQ